ncbi:hypothetical protein GPAL_2238 [Glaciecola pallidula DSM 14239 = ACAM 615]|uniref:Uncharacterized protein n=1 Tax=Brumicola pallidula DSM 14239 = ACAM 615 TaxID=1121922 RepID=K6Y8L7_9ALTE|nr:hypothetical protein GPAL_2238 [Glaciecola pallidula DSM 14239 = ACAM 615]
MSTLHVYLKKKKRWRYTGLINSIQKSPLDLISAIQLYI